jgi:hypothetical protein
LIAGVSFRSELPTALRRMALLVKNKEASGTTFEDALTLTHLKRLQLATNAFNEFVDAAMG